MPFLRIARSSQPFVIYGHTAGVAMIRPSIVNRAPVISFGRAHDGPWKGDQGTESYDFTPGCFQVFSKLGALIDPYASRSI